MSLTTMTVITTVVTNIVMVGSLNCAYGVAAWDLSVVSMTFRLT